MTYPMTSRELNLQANPGAAKRLRLENDLVKLERQFVVLRGQWHAAIAALAMRGGRTDPALAREIERWGAVLDVVEEHIERATVDLDAFIDGDAWN